MYTNNLEIIINAPVKNVWNALTDCDCIKEWMKNVDVKTDWKEGSPILYTCVGTDGNVLTWNGRQMIWDGIVDTVVPNKELAYSYPSKATGLEKETFHLVEMFPEVTKISFAQDCLSHQAAENYKDGTQHTLEKLKDFVEIRY